MKRKTFKTVLLCYLHLTCVLTHNILRLPNVRQAKFVLRHIDKVHATASYKQLMVASVQNCLDECVTDTSCKSTNFMKNQTSTDDLKTKDHFCELVAQDLTDKSEYVDKPGWKHYDTGRSMLTRIIHTYTGYCFYPEALSDCSSASDSWMELRSSATHCDSIMAYFEYDRDTGYIKHYCTGTLMCGDSGSPDNGLLLRRFGSGSTCEGREYQYNNYGKKWRLTIDTSMEQEIIEMKNIVKNELTVQHYTIICDSNLGRVYYKIKYGGNLEINGRCAYGKTASNGLDLRVSNSECNNAYSRVILKDIEQGPVKVSLWRNTQLHTAYGGFVSYIRQRTDNPEIYYLNDFSWYSSEDYDYFAVRMEAIFVAPETGPFKFILTADDFAVLYIHDCLTCSGYTRVANAFVNGCFDCISPDAFSNVINLTKGTKYYFEIFFMDLTEYDYLLLRMDTPSGTRRDVSFNDLQPHHYDYY